MTPVRIVFFALLISLLPGYAWSAPLTNVPVTLTQPDGKKIECFASGDEYFNYYHDEHGNLVAPDPATGYYVYVLQDKGNFYLTPVIVGSIDRRQASAAIKNLSPQSLTLFSPVFRSPYEKTPVRPALQHRSSGASLTDSPVTGQFNTIVVFIRFSDQSEFTTPASTYETMFNSSANGINSMKNYFTEVSYNQVELQSHIYPVPGETIVSYQDSHPRKYYSPYNASTNPNGYISDYDMMLREHALLKKAIDSVKSQIPSNLNVDADNDEYVDGVIFVIRGSNDGWASLLWPHAWALYSEDAEINNKKVWNYSFQIESMTGNGVLCHEMGHNMGYPDLYRYYNSTITPVGQWDIMANNTGVPQHSGAYMKYKYTKWISTLPKITLSGFYTLEPLYSATNNIYRIDSPRSATEFYVVEFRKKNSTFEQSIPGEGLVIYRINTAASGNAEGPPDEIYIYRPGGSNTTSNGTLSEAFYNSTVGRTTINDQTHPSGFLSDDAEGGLDISDVGAVGDTISFYVNLSCQNPVRVTNPSSYWTTVQKGYNAASSGATVQIQASIFDENLLLSHIYPVTLKGGYNCDFSSDPGWSIVNGSLTITGGPVIVENLIIK
jgi:M6 family metalloprotease-like protein